MEISGSRGKFPAREQIVARLQRTFFPGVNSKFRPMVVEKYQAFADQFADQEFETIGLLFFFVTMLSEIRQEAPVYGFLLDKYMNDWTYMLGQLAGDPKVCDYCRQKWTEAQNPKTQGESVC